MNGLVKPFVKWVGGKRQLIPEIEKRIPEKYSTYYEPFLGGGAVLLHLQPKKAVVNDFNSELINAYTVIRDDLDKLLEKLEEHKKLNDKDYFYEIRELDRHESYINLSNIEKAARLIYLNKTCFNGLYRVNKSGYFNTPYGRYKNPNIVNEIVLRALSNYLNEANIEFKTGDFKDGLKNIRKGAFVYFDPPYAEVSSTANYTGYTKGGFDVREQERLRDLCVELDKRGVKWMVSNANVPLIQELYQEFNIDVIGAKRSINSKADKRGEVEEVLIRNYE